MNYSPIQLSNKRTSGIFAEETLVFLPGWGFKSSIWKSVTQHLPPLSVIMQDLPTHVHFAFHAFSLDEITHEIDKQLPDNSILIAWSLSGLIALNLSMRYSKKYKRIILVASTPKFIKTLNWAGITQIDISTFHALAISNLPELMQTFHHMITDTDKTHLIQHRIQTHSISASQQDMLRYYLDILIQSDMRDHCKAIQIPVLHILGSRDPIIPVNHIKQIKKEYPSHQIHIIKEAGHIPFLTHTHEFLDEILKFVQPRGRPA